MKKAVINILALASVLTTAGFLLDGDAKDPSVLTRITEYVAMLTIIFTILSGFYFGTKLLMKHLQITK
ncbi:hypothetical protein MG290_11065 [Flavobacterium sp. CBA20B-1]|uniref:hypothetical protein n=1 Tax=unclassified Flavobacterium TaxID=196869 RepID=UPI0022251601|nr:MULTISPECIES: hypothetical protein [unclassified Flavobacterium]WCM41487.1 hypothetical protein MG290_11065 [Flavobacterium sp. CBA20B-1]